MRSEFECFVSQVVLDEIAAGDAEAARERMRTIANLPVLEATEEAELLTKAIMASGVMPNRAVRDAAHIAVAAVNDVDYLLTWNCRHLANAQVMPRVGRVCNAKAFNMPVICTPEELMGE